MAGREYLANNSKPFYLMQTTQPTTPMAVPQPSGATGLAQKIAQLFAQMPTDVRTRSEAVGRGFVAYSFDFEHYFWTPFREDGEDNQIVIGEVQHGRVVPVDAAWLASLNLTLA